MKQLSLIILLGLLTFSCSSSKKDDGGSASLTSEDSESTTMSYNNMDSDSGKAEGLETINFPYDSYALTPSARAVLKGNISYLKENSNVQIQVEGHCDERGSTQYNLALGENRAQAVKKYLVNAGVNSSRITTISYGEERPLVDASNEAAWAKNRRANFAIVSQ